MALQVSESDQIKQFKEFLGTYNKVTENCFMDCVKDFTTREVKAEESSCSESCLQKYLKMTQRISMRFQEYHIQQNEALAAKAGLLDLQSPGSPKTARPQDRRGGCVQDLVDTINADIDRRSEESPH
ncbi:mitochondrial import inner membrane translocase subunit Tim9 [Xyrichtys novacula]|uniref:Mitochondrial import inner membrane translocase subunit n=1 Tax=Xyrichtys novacula TaxID=13765 RepID=A0AAV1GLS9_XYRNO|nr:mitochondrial import inner membrane translocase subunit Tim9 [Xyrichtys novacula]